MLPRLILLAILVVGGMQAVSVSQQSNLLGLGRFVDRVRVDGNSDVGGTCTGVGCVKKIGLEIEKRSLGMMENEEDEEEEDEEDDGTAVEEGRGKKKKKKGYGKMMIALAGFTKAVMLYLMIHAVAAVAGKALIVAKVALAIAIALALKKMEHKTSYEIVKHPTYSHVQTHSSSVDYDHGSGGGGGGGGGGYEGGSRRRRRAAVYR